MDNILEFRRDIKPKNTLHLIVDYTYSGILSLKQNWSIYDVQRATSDPVQIYIAGKHLTDLHCMKTVISRTHVNDYAMYAM